MENTKRKIVVLIIILSFAGSLWAQQNSTGVSEARQVETFVSQLKNESYTSIFLPDFKPAHIPFLLEYADNDERIYNFPVNPLSSFKQPDCQLGIYVLWVIESIRLRQFEMRPGKIEWYPSQNPMIQRYIRPEFWKANTRGIQITAVQSYRSWWDSPVPNKEKFPVNPLEGSGLSWR